MPLILVQCCIEKSNGLLLETSFTSKSIDCSESNGLCVVCTRCWRKIEILAVAMQHGY